MSTTKTFSVTRNDGATAKIKAYRFETDGAGIRFYDDQDLLISSFAYGVITTVHNDDAGAFTLSEAAA